MKKIGWITGKKKLLRLAGLSLMGVLLLSGCGNTGKSAVAAASSTSASETSNEAGKGSKVSQPAENVDAQVAEASLPQPGEAISASLTWKSRMELAYATQFAVDTSRRSSSERSSHSHFFKTVKSMPWQCWKPAAIKRKSESFHAPAAYLTVWFRCQAEAATICWQRS